MQAVIYSVPRRRTIARSAHLCIDSVANPLITNVLHTSTVGAGFIPVLPASDKNQGNTPSCEGGDKPHPYGGGVLQAAYYQWFAMVIRQCGGVEEMVEIRSFD